MQPNKKYYTHRLIIKNLQQLLLIVINFSRLVCDIKLNYSLVCTNNVTRCIDGGKLVYGLIQTAKNIHSLLTIKTFENDYKLMSDNRIYNINNEPVIFFPVKPILILLVVTGLLLYLLMIIIIIAHIKIVKVSYIKYEKLIKLAYL
jgi:hypothetical protein